MKPALPEIDGEMNFQELMFVEAGALESQSKRYTWLIKKLKESLKDTTWKAPVVKIRARQQIEEFSW